MNKICNVINRTPFGSYEDCVRSEDVRQAKEYARIHGIHDYQVIDVSAWDLNNLLGSGIVYMKGKDAVWTGE